MLDDQKNYYQIYLSHRCGSPKGCSEAEVKALEDRFRHPFPRAYREFLLWMGADTEGAFRGSNWFAKDIVENTNYVPILLEENGIEWTPAGSILSFFGHQGYQAAWFNLPAHGDDPIVYLFAESQGMTAPESQHTFSSFLQSELEGVTYKA